MLTIVTTPRRVALISPYLPRMTERARQLDGHWSPDFMAWIFRPSAAKAVMNAARRHYQQQPDLFHLNDHPAGFPTIGQRALSIIQPDSDHPDHPGNRVNAIPIGLLLHTGRRTDNHRTRWEFHDASAVIQCDGEFFPGIHASRLQLDTDPYTTIHLPGQSHLAQKLEE